MIGYPNAKINIGLNIINKRNDGFHNLETLMVPIPLTDLITINPIKNDQSSNKVVFSSTGLTIDGSPNDNLILKAFRLLNVKYQLPATAIHLHKSIPFGAGLGGGSADAAFTLVMLNQLYQLNLTNTELEILAAELGSDCAFFIENKPAIATGRGEVLNAIDFNLKGYHLAIVIPPTPISTKEAYSKVTPAKPKYTIAENWNSPIENWSNLFKNDFEPSVYSQKPEIKKIKDLLYDAGANYASLSGSGSASYGIFKNLPKLQHTFPKNYFVRIYSIA